MSDVVFGAGAIGAVVGGRLSQAGYGFTQWASCFRARASSEASPLTAEAWAGLSCRAGAMLGYG